MGNPLAGKVVVGITSRALFDLEDAHRVFKEQDTEAYIAYQRKREHQVLKPGAGFALVQRLLKHDDLFEVVVFSRNDADSALRVLLSIQHYKLPIERSVFRDGRGVWPFLRAFGCDLFLSADTEDVVEARREEIASALVHTPPVSVPDDQGDEVRFALDGDAVLFDSESQRVFDRNGDVDEFKAYEAERINVPLARGPFWPLLVKLNKANEKFPRNEAPIRTALVTARSAPAHLRVINTFRHYGIRVNETYFLGGMDKTEMLAAFGAHMFFDDSSDNVIRAAARVPAAHVLELPDAPVAESAVRSPRTRRARALNLVVGGRRTKTKPTTTAARARRPRSRRGAGKVVPA